MARSLASVILAAVKCAAPGGIWPPAPRAALRMNICARSTAAAVERAQMFIRKAARGAGGQMPPGAAHFTAARMTLAKLRAMITANLDTYAAHQHDERALSSLDFQSSINLL